MFEVLESLFYLVMGAGFGISLLFLLLNWYINIKRGEEIPWNKFFAYLDCEFDRNGNHDYTPQGPQTITMEGVEYKVCCRCEKVKQFGSLEVDS